MININAYMLEELMNWRRWCLSSQGKGHCKSLEHRYQAESDLDRVATATVLVRVFDAIEIEKQISSYTFPKKPRRLIINEFVWHRPYQRSCKELGITFNDYDSKVINAVTILENRLHKAIDKQQERAHIITKLAEPQVFTY